MIPIRLSVIDLVVHNFMERSEMNIFKKIFGIKETKKHFIPIDMNEPLYGSPLWFKEQTGKWTVALNKNPDYVNILLDGKIIVAVDRYDNGNDMNNNIANGGTRVAHKMYRKCYNLVCDILNESLDEVEFKVIRGEK